MIVLENDVPNKKRKVSSNDCLQCYDYFKRAIIENRLFSEKTDHRHQSAVKDFWMININGEISDCIESLQAWINLYVDEVAWKKCYRAINQKNYTAKRNTKSVVISVDAYQVLQELNDKTNKSFSELIISLKDSPNMNANDNNSAMMIAKHSDNVVYLNSGNTGESLLPLSNQDYEALEECANYRNQSIEQQVSSLINQEKRHIEYDKQRIEQEKKEKAREVAKIYDKRTAKIGKPFKKHFPSNGYLHYPMDLAYDADDFIEELVKSSLISGKVVAQEVVKSKLIKITRRGSKR